MKYADTPRVPALKRRQSLGPAVVLMLAAAVVFLYTNNPASSNLFPPCPFHALTDYYCPGCGSLRALHQLLHGNLKTAFGLNPLAVLLLPFLGYAFISRLMVEIRGMPLPGIFVKADFIWGILAAIFLFWVLRNIPFYPFSMLAPVSVVP